MPENRSLFQNLISALLLLMLTVLVWSTVGCNPVRSRAAQLKSTGRDSIDSAGAYKSSLDINYRAIDGIESGLLSLDVYQPVDGDGYPVLVMVHGGGWCIGDKSNSSQVKYKAPLFTDNGYVYVSINYRLSPDVMHPAHVEDVAHALAWVEQHISEYGGDPGEVFVMGHSAGAHLAALVATDGTYLEQAGTCLELIKGVVLLDGAGIDMAVSREYLPDENWLTDMYVAAFGEDRGAWSVASPVEFVAEGKYYPPFLIFHVGDRYLSMMSSENLANALDGVGVYSKVVHAKDKNHGTLNRDIGKPDDWVTDIILEFLMNREVTDAEMPVKDAVRLYDGQQT